MKIHGGDVIIFIGLAIGLIDVVTHEKRYRELEKESEKNIKYFRDRYWYSRDFISKLFINSSISDKEYNSYINGMVNL